jgi:hypothetical protein
MALMANDAADRADQLILLSDRLMDLIARETRLTEDGLWAEARPVVEEKGKLAAAYQLEMRRIAQDSTLLAGAPAALRDALKARTAALRAALDAQQITLERARLLAEGLIRSIAEEVRAHQTQPIGYGPGAAPANRALALDVRG